MVGHMESAELVQADLAAYELAAREAAAWTEVRDRFLTVAADACRNDLGMSIRDAADELRISKSTLARTVWKDNRAISDGSGMSDLALEHQDQVWIKVGLGGCASPEAQCAAGLITEYERDALLDQMRRARTSISTQISEAVSKYPGISNIELPRMIVMASAPGKTPDLRHHADAAQCTVDADGRWWPKTQP